MLVRPSARAAPRDDLGEAWLAAPALTELAAWPRLLGDPRRLALVRLLTERERRACEFEEVLSWPRSRISHHLGMLRRAGLVATRRDAHWVYYSLVPEQHRRLRSLLVDALGPTELPPTALAGGAGRCSPGRPPSRAAGRSRASDGASADAGASRAAGSAPGSSKGGPR